MIEVGTICTGIGSPEAALKNMGIKHKVKFACEIDKFARSSYLTEFNPENFYEDMTKEQWDKLEQYADLVVAGIPCQAFSLAGKRMGELDPRGILFFDFYRYLKNQQPKAFIIENVKGLLSDNNGKTFQNWLLLLGNTVNGHMQMFNHEDSLEYNIHWQVLNSMNYGIPHNRERVFIVGIRNDISFQFKFPKGFKLDIVLSDLLEHDVDKKYFLSDSNIQSLLKYNERQQKNGTGFSAKFRATDCIMDALKVGGGGKDDLIYIKEATKIGYSIARPVDSINISIPDSKTRRGRVGKGVVNTLETQCNTAVFTPNVVSFGRSEEEKARRAEHFKKYGKDSGSFKDKTLIIKEQIFCDTLLANPNPQKDGLIEYSGRIRRLTPLEYWRLQGYKDEYFFKAQKVNSDRQLYKQAGNSITTTVMAAIFEMLLPLIS